MGGRRERQQVQPPSPDKAYSDYVSASLESCEKSMSKPGGG
jgi:hypothetical protein